MHESNTFPFQKYAIQTDGDKTPKIAPSPWGMSTSI